MELLLGPGILSGKISAIASKSMAHRLLLCAALSRKETFVRCGQSSEDIEATVQCLRAIGTDILPETDGFRVIPGMWQSGAVLPCGESGATLRFLLPVLGALGLSATFRMEGRLSQRPLGPLARELEAHGMHLSVAGNILSVSGVLSPGAYNLPGNVSSQYISGLLFALPLLNGASALTVTGPLESAPYVDMTLASLRQFGVFIARQNNHFSITPQFFATPGTAVVEGDWSSAAFWLGANALGSRVELSGLSRDSLQADRAAVALLPILGGNTVVDMANAPDLAPILAAVAAHKNGVTHFINAGRLRLKESDRIVAICAMVAGLGGQAEETPQGFTITGGILPGGTVDAAGDHRIAMAAAIAATACQGPVRILGGEAVRKSYPRFWRDYRALGGVILEELL